jgi:hypothetical protein
MRPFRIVSVIALVFVGLSGVIGGIPLIVNGDGQPWGMPQSLLQYSPFQSFAMPGIILFFAIGLLSFRVLWMTLYGQSGHGWWVTLQGCVLMGWLVVQAAMIRTVSWAQIVYAVIALALVMAGIMLARQPALTGAGVR